MRQILTFILILTSFVGFSQYPITEDFNSVNGVGEWTTDYGGFIETYGGVDHLAFADWPSNYSNSTTHTATSPTYDLSNCATDIEISFPFAGIIEDGFDYLYFDYFDGGVWVNDVSYTGSQNVTYTNSTIPNTTTQFRFRLVTNAVDPEYLNRWYADNLNGSFQATQNAQHNTRIDRSTQYIGFRGGPKQVLPYYYDITSFTISCASILPIELVSFTAHNYDNNVVLKWVTASETNNSVFELYHSTGITDWKLIDIKQGAGNSNTSLDYYTIHNNPQEENYYKLKQIDYDGKSTYSDVVYIKTTIKTTTIGYIYFNPLGQSGGLQIKKRVKPK